MGVGVCNLWRECTPRSLMERNNDVSSANKRKRRTQVHLLSVCFVQKGTLLPDKKKKATVRHSGFTAAKAFAKSPVPERVNNGLFCAV